MARTSPRARGAQSPIAAARIAAGLTQAQLAEKIGCIPFTVLNFEAGIRPLRGQKLSRAAEALGCGVEDLLALFEQTKNAERKEPGNA